MMSNEFEHTLQKKLSTLHKEKLPDRDLWPGIEMALMKRSRLRILRPTLAAALLFCILSGWLWIANHHTSENHTDALVAQLDAVHQQQMTALLATYKNLHPLTNNLHQQLQEMDRAATAIKQALRDDPGNITLLNMLTSLYQKQISLIQQVYQPDLQNPNMI